MSLLLALTAGGASGAISGTATLTFGQSATLRGSGRLIGTNGLTFAQTGLLRGSGRLSGTAPMAFSQAGTLRGSGRLVGTVPLIFGQTALLRGSGSLAGSIPMVFGQTGTLSGGAAPGSISGTTAMVFGATGALVSLTTPTFPSFNLSGSGRRWYIIKQKRLYLTNEELAYYLAREVIDAAREDIKVTYKTKPARVVSQNAYESLMATVRSLENMAPNVRAFQDIESEDDDEEALLLML